MGCARPPSVAHRPLEQADFAGTRNGRVVGEPQFDGRKPWWFNEEMGFLGKTWKTSLENFVEIISIKNWRWTAVKKTCRFFLFSMEAWDQYSGSKSKWFCTVSWCVLSSILYDLILWMESCPKDVPYCNSVRTSNLRKTPRLDRTDPFFFSSVGSSPPTRGVWQFTSSWCLYLPGFSSDYEEINISQYKICICIYKYCTCYIICIFIY